MWNGVWNLEKIWCILSAKYCTSRYSLGIRNAQNMKKESHLHNTWWNYTVQMVYFEKKQKSR